MVIVFNVIPLIRTRRVSLKYLKQHVDYVKTPGAMKTRFSNTSGMEVTHSNGKQRKDTKTPKDIFDG